MKKNVKNLLLSLVCLLSAVRGHAQEADPSLEPTYDLIIDKLLTYNERYSNFDPASEDYISHNFTTRYSLCSNATYNMTKKGSTTISDSVTVINEQESGAWILQRNAQGGIVLFLVNMENGAIKTFNLTFQNGKTFLNGVRYFRTGFSDEGYEPNCPRS